MLAGIVNFLKLNREICEALELDPAAVESITIRFAPRDVSIEVRYLATRADSVPAMLKRYSLVERGEPK